MRSQPVVSPQFLLSFPFCLCSHIHLIAAAAAGSTWVEGTHREREPERTITVQRRGRFGPLVPNYKTAAAYGYGR